MNRSKQVQAGLGIVDRRPSKTHVKKALHWRPVADICDLVLLLVSSTICKKLRRRIALFNIPSMSCFSFILSFVIGTMSVFAVVDFVKNGLPRLIASITASCPGVLLSFIVANLLVLDLVLVSHLRKIDFFKTIKCAENLTTNYLDLVNEGSRPHPEDLSTSLVLMSAVQSNLQFLGSAMEPRPTVPVLPDLQVTEYFSQSTVDTKVTTGQSMPGGYLGESSTTEIVFLVSSCGLEGSIFIGWISVSSAIQFLVWVYGRLLEYYAIWHIASEQMSLLLLACHTIRIAKPTYEFASPATEDCKDEDNKDSIDEAGSALVDIEGESICPTPRPPPSESQPSPLRLSICHSATDFTLHDHSGLPTILAMSALPLLPLSVLVVPSESSDSAIVEDAETSDIPARKPGLNAAAPPFIPSTRSIVAPSQDAIPATLHIKEGCQLTRALSLHARDGCLTRITSPLASTPLNASSSEFVPRAREPAPTTGLVDKDASQAAPSSAAVSPVAIKREIAFRTAPPSFWSAGGSAIQIKASSSPEASAQAAVVDEDADRHGLSTNFWAAASIAPASARSPIKREIVFRRTAPSFWSPGGSAIPILSPSSV
ncbi:hypothetical protein B0H12DRAFT_267913 [Mycena haematopus]|nr:hypothetical protein B0H12DRAFT_267913 [Mycena haematopus]